MCGQTLDGSGNSELINSGKTENFSFQSASTVFDMAIILVFDSNQKKDDWRSGCQIWCQLVKAHLEGWLAGAGKE